MNQCKDVRVNIEDEELVKMFNPTLKKRETILFFLIVVVRTRFDLNPKREWIQAHVAQTMNL